MMFPIHLFIKAFTSLPAGRPLLEANSHHSLAMCYILEWIVSRSASFKSSTDSEFNEYVAQPLRELELILLKLKTQLKFCFIGILLTILLYLFIWSISACCALPFQESSCAVKSILPLMTTNYSTLAGEVDGFVVSAQAKVSTLHDAIEMPSLTDRLLTLQITDYDLWELIQEHSANLAAFGAIKREDERMEELEEAVSDGYSILKLFAFFGTVYLWVICLAVYERKISKRAYLANLKELSDEDGENLQNARLKKLKRQIPIFYLATLICILVQFGLYVTFIAGQYYAGSCPIYALIEDTRKYKLKRGETYLPKSFTKYTTFADELQATLDVHFQKLNKSIQSPVLEVRQLGWDYEEDAIDRAFIHHMGLKQYHVDRNAMPRQISHALRAQEPLFYFGLIFSLLLSIVPIWRWIMEEGSVWRPWQFIKYYF
ncbi:hypothetical protein Ddc_10204 [Ditylenchus destructor]|nr:hypothetical protein Ddc_10204 [Ditylenchus destructor]